MLQTIDRYRMLEPQQRVVVGFSGGADSTAPLFALHRLEQQLDIRVEACHINHCLRGEESERDQQFCTDFCKRYNIPLTVHRIWAQQEAKQAGQSVETFSRQRRYQLLTALADCGIEQYTRTMQGLQCAVTEEKTLTAETAAALPGTGESVLDITGSFAAGSAAPATGQVSVQGTLQIQICSQNTDTGELTVRSKDLAVQQTLELPGVTEDDTALVRGEVLACTLSAVDGAGEASLSVTWKLRVEVWRSVQHTVVADAYSTLCKTQTVQTVCRLLQKTADLTGRIPVTLDDDLPDAEGTVLGCFVTLGALCAAQADGNKAETHLKLLGKGTAHVFISDARGELTCYDKAFTWQPDGLWPGSTDGAWPSVGASVARVASSKNGARLRVDLEIEISGALFQAQSFDALCGVELGEEYDDSDGPALYIYYARQGERIFDIARRYHARARDLAAANHLDTNGDPPQELTTDTACLLIPAAL